MSQIRGGQTLRAVWLSSSVASQPLCWLGPVLSSTSIEISICLDRGSWEHPGAHIASETFFISDLDKNTHGT